MTPNAIAKQLDAVLERECEALRSGQVESLASVASEKERLFDALAKMPCSPEVLAHLRDGMQRNALLAEAASLGIRDAINRLQDIKTAAGPINGYSGDGTRQTIGPGQSTRDLKA